MLNIEGAFLLMPFMVGRIYQEQAAASFIIVAGICFAIGTLLVLQKPKRTTFFSREGFAVTSLSWIVMSFFGCLPFVINKDIPNFIDALFETVSGFTTTGASIVQTVETLSHASMFWRCFTLWIGGMGVLVFLLALLPMTGGTHVNIMKAESPGPSVDKLLPKVRQTAFVLYAIYVALTALELLMLLFGGMPIFDAVNIAFSTAGTGGFSVHSNSIAGYSSYIQWVIIVFMVLFGINFGFYFLILTRRFRRAFGFHEVRNYLCIMMCACIIIYITLIKTGSCIEMTFPEKLRHTVFHVTSIMTTTGFSTIDYVSLWPQTANMVILALMFIGGCAGSTSCGIKVSRITILLKTLKKELTLLFHPSRVLLVKNENKIVAHETIRSTNVYMISYLFVFSVSLILISFDDYDFTTNFTAVAATINNIGPGFAEVGPTGNFSLFSGFSKIVMIFNMLAGRLELYPMLMLITPEFWRHVFHPKRGIRIYKQIMEESKTI